MANISFWQGLALYLLAGMAVLGFFALLFMGLAWFANRPTIRLRAPKSTQGVVDAVSELRKLLDDKFAPIALLALLGMWPVVIGLCIYWFLKKEDAKKPVN